MVISVERILFSSFALYDHHAEVAVDFLVVVFVATVFFAAAFPIVPPATFFATAFLAGAFFGADLVVVMRDPFFAAAAFEVERVVAFAGIVIMIR